MCKKRKLRVNAKKRKAMVFERVRMQTIDLAKPVIYKDNKEVYV